MGYGGGDGLLRGGGLWRGRGEVAAGGEGGGRGVLGWGGWREGAWGEGGGRVGGEVGAGVGHDYIKPALFQTYGGLEEEGIPKMVPEWKCRLRQDASAQETLNHELALPRDHSYLINILRRSPRGLDRLAPTETCSLAVGSS